MATEGTRKSIWTPANIVTMVRIIFIPVFVLLILAPWTNLIPQWEAAVYAKPWIAAGVFAVLAMTDGVDGYLARSRNEVTNFGKFIDPIADKLLVTAALLALIELGTLPSWIALVIIAREFLVSGLRMIAATSGKVIAASWIGKWKTAVTIVAILMFIIKDTQFFLMNPGYYAIFNVIAWITMIAAVILTIISMIDYFAKSASLILESD